jgi:hypothetical protein
MTGLDGKRQVISTSPACGLSSIIKVVILNTEQRRKIMLEDNNQFQSRLDAISKVEIVLHVNGDWHELQIESTDNRLTGGALKYTQYVSLFPGKTLYSFLPQLIHQQPLSLKICVLLHKPECTVFPVTIDYLGFSIPDRFVVGYGLDYDGFGRNLPEIYQLSEETKT